MIGGSLHGWGRRGGCGLGGAIIAFDDYTWEAEASDPDGTPKPAVDAFCAIYRNKIELLNRGRQVWIRKTAD